MIDTVVIFAAGRGTRMRELTQDIPKHVIVVGKRPFLFYLLDNLYKAGFKKIIVVVGYQKEVMKERLQGWHKLPIEIIEQYLWVPESEYGTLCPIKAVQHLLAKETFVALNGDNLYSVKDLKTFHVLSNLNVVAGLKHNYPEKYGALVLQKDGSLSRIVEKPQKFVSNLINVGLYAFTPDIFTIAPQIGLSPRGEYEITAAINLLASQNKVKVLELTGYWLDFTKPEDINIVEDFIASGKL